MNDSSINASAAVVTPAEESVSALSVWAVALGALSVLTVGLTAMPAIICGYVALADASKRRAGLFEKRAAAAGLLAGCVGALLLATVLTAMLRS